MNKKQAKQYRLPSWHERCLQIIQADGGKCCVCGRSEPDVVLQVHHKRYIPGRKPWEYPLQDLITLCKGCHAREHNLLPNAIPQDGWEWIGGDDLGDLVGTCELCGTAYRHEFYLFNPNYGYIAVGCECANKLLNNDRASILDNELKLKAERLQRFLDSPKWERRKDCHFYKNLDNFKIMIVEKEYGCYITLFYKYYGDGYFGTEEKEQKLHSKKKYSSLEDAKRHIFNVITNRKILKYLEANDYPMPGSYY